MTTELVLASTHHAAYDWMAYKGWRCVFPGRWRNGEREARYVSQPEQLIGHDRGSIIHLGPGWRENARIHNHIDAGIRERFIVGMVTGSNDEINKPWLEYEP